MDLSFATAGLPTISVPVGQVIPASQQGFLAPSDTGAQQSPFGSNLVIGVGVVAALGALAVGRTQRRATTAAKRATAFVSLTSSAPLALRTVREQLVACRAELQERGCALVEEVDAQIDELEAAAKKAVAGAAAAMVFVGGLASEADAYPIYAQQNYKQPVEATGKIVCANCHLQSRPIDVRAPHDVLPDTIFKMTVEVPAKFEKRLQLNATGEKVNMNVGAVVVLPEGWKLAPRDRLPKELKKEMKGLAWAQYSAEKPNIVVAGPVPGLKYSKMILPVLTPIPDGKITHFDKYEIEVGGNRGRGQVYPEGNQSNNNVFTAKFAGVVKSIEGDTKKTISIEQQDGTIAKQEVLEGADIVVKVGDTVLKDEQLTTNPNVGGFGQQAPEIVLQDVNRVYAVEALMTSIFIAQLTFVLKKKQFEKVQLAEGF